MRGKEDGSLAGPSFGGAEVRELQWVRDHTVRVRVCHTCALHVCVHGRDGERVRLDGEDELHGGNGVRDARHIASLGEGTPAVDT